jgi:hypothetical protein
LGVKNLRLQGLALRARWEWLRRTDATWPWAGLPRLPNKEAEEVFFSLATGIVGNGRRILFWLDRWVNGSRILEIAPEVAAAVSTRHKNTHLVADGLYMNNWVLDVQGNLSAAGYRQLIILWVLIRGVAIDEDEIDRFVSAGAASGKYTARETYKLLCQGGIRLAIAIPIWRSWAPLKCKLFGWKASKYRLWTSDRRFRHGLQAQTSACFTCLHDEDTVDHILANCVFVREVWMRCLHRAGLVIADPQRDDAFQSWWLRARALIHKTDRRQFDTLVLLTVWSLWK